MTDLTLFRVYEPHELGADGYPLVWHELPEGWLLDWSSAEGESAVRPGAKMGVKDVVRHEAGHRCERCGHPFIVGQSGSFEEDDLHARRTERDTGFSQAAVDAVFEGMAEQIGDPTGARRTNWSPCDERCTHGGPIRVEADIAGRWDVAEDVSPGELASWIKVGGLKVEAAWRILTVHHLNGRKEDLRWHNLCALCQRKRCHLVIQKKVVMEQIWPLEHSAWFRPFAAAYYARVYLGEELTREQTMERLDELLALERADG